MRDAPPSPARDPDATPSKPPVPNPAGAVQMSPDPFLDSSARLRPGDAVAAILLLDDGRYLLQHRDPKPEIFFPDHWGCFGGGVDEGETDDRASLARELVEELDLAVDQAELKPFTRLDFDVSFAGCGRLYRTYFELRVPAARLSTMRLGEGREMRAFTGRDLLQLRVAPYDTFVLWMHINRGRLAP
jgi:8-oxo-dGTP pyrophosphatase MutT (NUDIX family)